jgi:hypothetical protein
MKRTLILCALCALPALAADPPPGAAQLRDHDGDGRVSLPEARNSVVDAVMKQADANKDGRISRAEAAAIPAPAATDEQNKEKLKRILLDFNKADANGDGEVSRDELTDHVKKDPATHRVILDQSKLANPAMQGADRTDTVPLVGYHFKM